MTFVTLLVGAVLIVTAINRTYPALASELESDVPAYGKWALAIAAILALGYIPGARTPSRLFLVLVVLVIVLTNYQQILAGLTPASRLPAPSATIPTAPALGGASSGLAPGSTGDQPPVLGGASGGY